MTKYICEECQNISERNDEQEEDFCFNKNCEYAVYSCEELLRIISSIAGMMPYKDHYTMINMAQSIKDKCKLLEILIKEVAR